MSRVLSLSLLVLAISAVLAPAAFATVRVSRAELSGTKLRIEGTAAPSRAITVNGVAMTNSDAAGNFRLERDPFARPADCRVAVNDGSATATSATLAGCTVSTAPAPPPTTTASLSAVQVAPTDVLGGTPATGTVRLTSAAGSGGFVVTLSSDNPAAATVPAGVTVPAGATSATFPVTTNVVPNPQSALIIGTAGSVTKFAIITAWTPALFNSGSVSILPGGNGSGVVTSQPAGINCTITRGNGSGTCTKSFPIGTVLRLDARPAADSSFRGFRSTPGCADASRVTISRGVNITCQAGFTLR